MDLSDAPASLPVPEEYPARRACFLLHPAAPARDRVRVTRRPPGPGHSLCRWRPNQSGCRASGTEPGLEEAIQLSGIPHKPEPFLLPPEKAAVLHGWRLSIS